MNLTFDQSREIQNRLLYAYRTLQSLEDKEEKAYQHGYFNGIRAVLDDIDCELDFNIAGDMTLRIYIKEKL